MVWFCTRPIGHLDLRNVAAVAVYARINMNVFGADPLSLGGCSNDSISPWPLSRSSLVVSPLRVLAPFGGPKYTGFVQGISASFFGRCDEMT